MLPLISLDFFIIRHQTFINSQNFQNRIRLNLKLEAFQSLEISLPLQGPLEFGCSFYLPLPRTKIRLKNKIYGLGGVGGGALGEATLLQATNDPVEVLSNTQTLSVSFRLFGKKKIQPASPQEVAAHSRYYVGQSSQEIEEAEMAASESNSQQQFYQGVPTERWIPQQPRSGRFWPLEDWVVGLLFLGLVALSCRAWVFRRTRRRLKPNVLWENRKHQKEF